MIDFPEWFWLGLFYASPFLIIIIVQIVKELLDILINYQSITKLNDRADKLSFEGITEKIKDINSKIYNSNELTVQVLENKMKIHDLDIKEKRTYKKKDIKAIEYERMNLKKTVRDLEFKINELESIGTNKQKIVHSSSEFNRECKLRKIFNPD